jgi:hypothetical protein
MTAYTQIATYFEKDSVNEYGEQTFLTPSQINVRWESKTVNYIDQKTGKETISNSIIFCRTELKIDSYIFLGTTSETYPKNINAYVIRRVDNLLGLKNGKTIYKIYL